MNNMNKKINFFIFLLIFLASALVISNYVEATDSTDPKPVITLNTPQVNNLVTTLSGSYALNCGELKENWCKDTNGSNKGSGAVEITWNDGTLTCDSLPATHTYQADSTYRIRARVKNTCGYIGEVYYDLNTIEAANVVNSITLTGSSSEINWTFNGTSTQGFEVVWSKNVGPTYSTRTGDSYHYFSDSTKSSDSLNAFDGEGVYYVRVCEYLNGACGVYSNEIAVTLKSDPIVCTLDYNPVCGADGITYGNKCMAQKVAVAYTGECKKNCTIQCLKNEPVCGADGNTYSCGEAEATCNNIKVSYNGECKIIVPADEITIINDNAKLLIENQISTILIKLNEPRNLENEQQVEIKYLKSLASDLSNLTDEMNDAIKNFVAYGVDNNTKALGEGERAAVIFSYKIAYGELPKIESDLVDVIKIANGRWPSEKSTIQENKAKIEFNKIYGRLPNLSNANDNAAVTVMAYGLRQKAENRKLASEQKGMEIFKKIYGHNPSTTEEWNILQAITYSGVKR